MKILYTKFPETATNWMNMLKDNCINYSGYNTVAAQTKLFSDISFDVAHASYKESNYLAILEQDSEGAWPTYSVSICKINFTFEPDNKEQVINKIFKIEDHYDLYPKEFSDMTLPDKVVKVFSTFTNIYYSSNSNKVFALGISYFNKASTEFPQLVATVDGRVISKSKSKTDPGRSVCVKTSLAHRAIQGWLHKKKSIGANDALTEASSKLS